MEKLNWCTIGYSIAELKPAGGVVTQRDILEKYKADYPGEEIRAHAGFKCDQENKTVSIRIGIADPTIAADSGTVAKIEPELLQSERDKLVALKEKYDALVEAVGKDAQKFSAMLVENEELKKQLEVFLDEDHIAGDDAEDSADLVEAKKAIAEDDSISLDEIEDAVENLEPVFASEDGGDE